MKTIIIESIWAKPHLETAGEIALNLKNEGHDVSFAWIGSNLYWHEWDIPKILKILGCNTENRIKKFQNLLRKKHIKIIDSNLKFRNEKIEVWANKFSGNINDLKNYKYKGLPLGMGVASSLITFYNNKNPNLRLINSKVINLLCTSALIYKRSFDILTKYKPDKIITFNNRFASSLPIILAAEQNKIPIIRHDRGSNYKKYFLYKYDINDPRNFKNIFKDWNKNKKDNKELIAKNFFKKKFDGTFKDEVNKNFTKNQVKGLVTSLPKSKKIITYYTSTEYEQDAYLKLKYNQLKTFKIFYNLIHKQKNIHLVIRVHPSLSSRNDRTWNEFKNKNTTIISSISKIDTYALMKKSNLVCGYSSRIVLESAYLKIPTICFKDFGWPNNIGILYGEKKNTIENNIKIALKKKIKFNINKILAVSYFYSVYGIKYKFFKASPGNKGKFLNDELEWKSSFIIFLQKYKFDKIYFKLKEIYRFFL
jgi:hypothetical protein